MNNQEYMNAKQVYEMFGISRSLLVRLADAGKVTVRKIEDEYGVLNLYRVSDIQKIIEGDDHE